MKGMFVTRRQVDDAYAEWARARRALVRAQLELSAFSGKDEEREALKQRLELLKRQEADAFAAAARLAAAQRLHAPPDRFSSSAPTAAASA